MKIIAGNSNKELSEAISAYLDIPLTQANVKRFSDMEVFVEIMENVRGEDVFFIQSTSYPANDHLMELLIAIDALKRGSARRITAVIPYFGYARQDRKGEEICIVSPDVGGVVRARALAKRVSSDLAIIDKRREKAGVSEVMNVIGDVKGKVCILVDDIVDSGGTLCNAAQALIDNGAKTVYAYVVHGVLSGGAVARIADSPMERLVITDTIAATEAVLNSPNIEQVSVATLMGEAMRRISEERSISELFRYGQK